MNIVAYNIIIYLTVMTSQFSEHAFSLGGVGSAQFLCRTLSVRVQKEHLLLTTYSPAKSAQPLYANSEAPVLNCARTKVKHRCARIHMFSLLQRVKSNPVRHSAYTEKLSTRTHVRRFFSFKVHEQFVVVRLSVSTGTYICSL